MDEVFIAEHALKHGVSPQDIEHAWVNFVRKQYRGSLNDGEIVVIGIGYQWQPSSAGCSRKGVWHRHIPRNDTSHSEGA